jgi:hypothetical protein
MAQCNINSFPLAMASNFQRFQLMSLDDGVFFAPVVRAVGDAKRLLGG